MQFWPILRAADVYLQTPPKTAAIYAFELVKSKLPASNDPDITIRVKHILWRSLIGAIAAGAVGCSCRYLATSCVHDPLLQSLFNLYTVRTVYSGVKAVLCYVEQPISKASHA